jgi:hypothetical protein
VLGRLGQRERRHVRLTDRLIPHDTSAAEGSAAGAARGSATIRAPWVGS